MRARGSGAGAGWAHPPMRGVGVGWGDSSGRRPQGGPWFPEEVKASAPGELRGQVPQVLPQRVRAGGGRLPMHTVQSQPETGPAAEKSRPRKGGRAGGNSHGSGISRAREQPELGLGAASCAVPVPEHTGLAPPPPGTGDLARRDCLFRTPRSPASFPQPSRS